MQTSKNTKTTKIPSFQPRSLTDLLRERFLEKCRVNPRYSLRAYAQFLEVENSWLSKIFRGQKNMSAKSVEHIGKKLGLSLSEIEAFKKAKKSSAVKAPEQKYMELKEDLFHVISDWYHVTILELIKIKSGPMSAKWIAQTLNISVHQASDAVERLKRVALITEEEDGSLTDLADGFTSHNLGPNYSSYANRKYQKQILELSIGALESLPIEQRDHSSMAMATNTSKLQEAKRRIDQFRYELCAFLEDCEEKNTVYQLGVSLFPLTKEIKTKEKK